MDGDWIKEGRVRTGRMSQKQLAERVGVSERTIQNWERGGPVSPGDRALLESIFGGQKLPTVAEVLATASDLDLIRALAQRLARLRAQIPEAVDNGAELSAGIEEILASSDLNKAERQDIRNKLADTRSGDDTTES